MTDHATDEGEAGVVVERLPPAEAFELVAHETRLGILEALNDADAPVPFADLRRRVGVDDPGQFNYHLGKLTGRFVRQREGADGDGGDDDGGGYVLAPAGRRLVGAVLSGGYTKGIAGDSVPVDGTCDACGDGALAAAFAPESVRIHCEDCGFVVTEPRLPPGVLEGWSREEAPAVVDRWLRRNQVSAAYGFCHNCDGRMDRTLCLPGDERAPDWFAGEVSAATVVSACRRCGHWWHAVVETAVQTHPAVAGFHHEHGVDVRRTPTWELSVSLRDAQVEREDPLRVAVPVSHDGRTREFVFDRDVTLVAERPDPST